MSYLDDIFGTFEGRRISVDPDVSEPCGERAADGGGGRSGMPGPRLEPGLR